MSNPFAALQVYDDEEDGFGKNQDLKGKKGDFAKKNVKNDKAPVAKKAPEQNKNEDINIQPRHHAETNPKKYREGRPEKDIGEGHTLDRRSGTGRVDRPRKEGGGRGNIGNLEDEKKREKYLKNENENDTQANTETEETKPVQPQGKTLQEYYQSKGVNLEDFSKKQDVKKEKGEINAEWIKKEKLTVIQTKEDKKISERIQIQGGKKQYNQTGPAENEIDANLLGFTSKVSKPQERQERQERPERPERQERTEKGEGNNHKGDGKPQYKNKKKEVVNLKQQDFPAL